MNYDNQRIKSNARLFYKNNTGTSIAVPLIYMGISAGAVFVSYMVVLIVSGIGIAGAAAISGGNEAVTLGASALSAMMIYALMIAISLAIMPLGMGMMDWYRRTIYSPTPVSEMFSPYKNGRFWGSVGTIVLTGLFTYLWSLLFIIPGIIKIYSYSQAMFIKAENPDIPASRAIKLSMLMMDGHKADLLSLHIGFLGWFILSSFTYNILGIVYVFPYYYAALAFAYEEIKADAAARGVIDLSEIKGDAVPNMY